MRVGLGVAVLFSGWLVQSALSADEREAFFEARIRPVLVTTCLKCHGTRKASNHLQLDRREALLKGGDSGPAIVAGDPEKSLLIKALRYRDEDLRMPPTGKLPDTVIADFERWIREGAIWPAESAPRSAKTLSTEAHWAFQPVKKLEPPRDPSGWSVNPIDAFIHAAIQSHGLAPTRLADKRTLLRRAAFDLVGLPPSPNEVTAFLADGSPHAFDRVVERLLDSPQYGERWGRYWMDVVRYADTAGDNADYPIPEARLYRDYIIDSFNADLPYDQFVREQLAGDLLARQAAPETYAREVTATGFLALSRRYATAPYELWHLTLEDTIDTVGRAFLGISLRCARCHDHKFDPVTQRDYYALYGIFDSTRFPYAGSEEFQSMKFGRRAFMPLAPAAKARPAVAAYQAQMGRLRKEIARLQKSNPGDRGAAAKIETLAGRLRLLERRGSPAGLRVAYAVSEGTIHDVPVQLHGEPSQPGNVVPRGAPHFLSGLIAPAPTADESGRLELANWIASPSNPLTARVMVNRIWQHHFGRGIVGTPSNFGTRGAPPTHPQLLDWLTDYFVEHRWSVKALHRLIMQSRTYQLASSVDNPGDLAKDPANRWYARFERQRLDAEAIRDAMLCASGELELDRPGDHPFPPIRDWHWTQHDPFKAVYPSKYRSVYLMTQRLYRHPFLGLFDGPDTNTTTDVRSRSTVPLQALFLMNSDFMRDTAGAFARRLCRESSDIAARIDSAHELVYSRPAQPTEIERARQYLDQYEQAAKKAGLDRRQAESEAWLSYARTILCSNEFFYID